MKLLCPIYITLQSLVYKMPYRVPWNLKNTAFQVSIKFTSTTGITGLVKPPVSLDNSQNDCGVENGLGVFDL